jgi:biopolymer transport protein TolQ
MTLWSFIAGSGWFSRLILALLVVLSLVTWAVILERARHFRRAARSGGAFERAAAGQAGLEGLVRLAAHHADASAARLIGGAAEGLARLLPPGTSLITAPALHWERQLAASGSLELARHERYLGWLATVSSASPFIGLLGTVWGVMVAFLRIGSSSGQAMLEVVGPGIAEALIATVAGLATAIPATVAYNFFSAAAGRERQRMESAGTQVELLVRSGDRP